jgi:putative membrane protein
MRQPMHTTTRTLLALTAVATLAACGKGDSAAADSSAAGMSAMAAAPAPAAAPAAPAVTDPQIAAIVVAANTVDIEAGELAQSKGTNAKVKEFGAQMVRDHKAVNKQATDLVTKLNVTPEPNATAQSLTDGGKANTDSLKNLSGAAFDKAYIANEVTYHQAVLDAIDKTLIPNAQNAELRALLEKVRPNIAAHLEHARSVQSAIQ